MQKLVTMKDLVLKIAMPDDFDRLWQLVNESLSGQKTRITYSSLQEDLFSEREIVPDAFVKELEDPAIELDLSQAQLDVPFCRILLAQEGAELVGYMMFHEFYSPWRGREANIDYVYVKPAYRNMGVASGLMQKLMELCRAENLVNLIFDVSHVDPGLRNTLDKYGSKVARDDNTDWSVYRIEF